MTAQHVLIGTVGYYQFVRAYPLGPEFMQRLQAISWPINVDVVIKEMNWGPIAIVQDLQADLIHYDRVILVSTVDRGAKEIGQVSCRHWQGATELEPASVQQRVYEGVTGIISVDNLLVIGEYFKVWPDEVITVEVELPEQFLGDLVRAEMVVKTSGAEVIGEQPLDAAGEEIMQCLLELTQCAVLEGVKGLPDVQPLTVEQLKPVSDWHQQEFAQHSAY